MSVVFWLTLVCAVTAFAQGDACEFRIVQTAQGPVKGYENNGVYEFFGIPYATAPTGAKKFTAPLPGPEWTQPLEATNKKVICPQPVHFDLSTYSMQENCLVAHVYMPDTEKTNLPVMVYFHGGAYQIGWGAQIPSNSLVRSKKVVAVTFNYRLGTHGFLCLGTEDAPGNAGLKDQLALIRWVKKNIANFGGNPEDVTIVGGSAGSSSVDLLMLSKSTAGLFNKVIPESGANVDAFSIQVDPLQVAKNFARIHNFHEVDDINTLEEFYKSASYDLLTSYAEKTKNSTIGFVPCIERNIGLETILEEAPINILKQGKYRKVPMLYGFANMEGLISIKNYPKWKDDMNADFSQFLPGDLQFPSEEERKKVGETVKKFYFGDQPVDDDTVLGFVNFITDVLIAHGTLRATQLHVQAGNNQVYLYEYSFYSPPPQNDNTPPYMEKLKGAYHCAQSVAVHELATAFPDKREKYLKLRKILQEMWLNFVITGKPVPEGSKLPEWPPVGDHWSPHMELGEEIKLEGSLLEERTKFWDGIYERYYRTPIPPPPRV